VILACLWRYRTLLQFYAVDTRYAAQTYLICSNGMSLVRPLVTKHRVTVCGSALVPSLLQLAAVCSELQVTKCVIRACVCVRVCVCAGGAAFTFIPFRSGLKGAAGLQTCLSDSDCIQLRNVGLTEHPV
jgi:hypothetical protein